MKWITAFANGLGFLFAVSLLKNASELWQSLAYAKSLDDSYVLTGRLVYIIGLLLLASLISINVYRRPVINSLARTSAFLLALLIPSYEWPRDVWKLKVNERFYNELIFRDKTEPKIVILDRRDAPLSVNGIVLSWLIYDKTEEILLPAHLRSDHWKKAAPSTLYTVVRGDCPVKINRIKKYYFYVVADCTQYKP